MTPLTSHFFVLEPQYQERVWGGQKLKAATPPVGEAWIAYERSRVRGQEGTVGDLARDHGPELLGEKVAARFGTRFPLLIKLLDCADWLSVQVHPNDEQAERLVGPGHFGKTEAWHFLEVDPGASILAGVTPGTTPEALAAAIRGGTVLDVSQKFEVGEGETVFIPAGTLHALGPGMLLYEVQQLSDTTYRVYDWDRPASAGRQLHIEESVAVTDPGKSAVRTPRVATDATSATETVTCPYFTLEVLNMQDSLLARNTKGQSFHLLTVTEGVVEIAREGETVLAGPRQTVLVAGSAGAYEVRPQEESAKVLCASVPGQ